MALPYFYESDLTPSSHVTLSEETSRHCIQVLRMKAGQSLQLTNGKGMLCTATITGEDKRRAVVAVSAPEYTAGPGRKICIGISLLKNTSRFEWFLEKATEIGVSAIQPLLCARTEHHRFKMERMHGILVSAMLQSQQSWLPVLYTPVSFGDALKNVDWPRKLIAHCEDDMKQPLTASPAEATQLLIGPEGDFTPQEIALALQHGYRPVSLGNTRLRTETAGMAGATLLAIG